MERINHVDFDKYTHFVDAVTSTPSKDFKSLVDRLGELDREGANIERLTTAGVGINAEAVSYTHLTLPTMWYV